MQFPTELFSKSCLIYKKGTYGIFYLEGKDGKYYTVKVTLDTNEVNINKYIKENAGNNPNLLIVKGIYYDKSPIYLSLFSDKNNKLVNPVCKNLEVEKIFSKNTYLKHVFYLTEACLYNLGFYLGTYGGRLSYQEFVNYTFEMFSALQTLHSLNIWHRDIKPANFLICEDKDINSVKYIFAERSWKVNNIDNKFIKLIDFGDAIIQEVTNPCIEYQYEVNVALLNVIRLMWIKINDEKNNIEYEDLIERVKNCQTSLLDIMLNAKIFDKLVSEESADIKVELK